MAPINVNNVRFSYCNLFQPVSRNGQDPKFSVTILVPKANAAAKAAIDAAVNEAISYGVSAKWNGVRPPKIDICVHDGDGPRPSDGQPFGAERRGCWVFTASCKADRKPTVVDANVQHIIDPAQVYSGMWGNVNVNFFPYNANGKKGIGCGLNCVQKVRDDEPLGNTVTAESVFSVVSAETAGPAYNPAPAATGYAAPAATGYAAPAPTYTPAATGYAAPAPGYAQQGYGGAPAVDPITGRPMN